MAEVSEYLELSSPADLGIDAYATTDDQCTNWNACHNKATRIEMGVRACDSCVVRDEGNGNVSVRRR